MAKKVLVATEKPFAPVAVGKIREIVEGNGFELNLLEKYTEKSQLLDAVKDVEAVIIRSDKVDAEVIEAGKKLEVVVRAGAGYDNVDLEAATKNNVCVMNTPGQNANAVAELAFGLLLYSFRSHFDGKNGKELMGKRLGVLSYGNIGTNVCRIAQGFGMEVFSFQRLTPSNFFWKDGIRFFNDKKLMFENCDIIVLAMPATSETKKMVNYELLSALPKNATVVNVARKDLMNEDDLLKVLSERPDITYLTDVKPDNEAAILETCPKQYDSTAKKMGAQTSEANVNAGLAAAKQICTFFQTGQAKFRVNK